jgi:hypothetical protein
MKIAIIGTGNVGGALGRRWAHLGHEVLFGSREPAAPRIRDLLHATGGGARALTPGAAAASAEVVVLATPWAVTEKTIASLGPLRGKIVVDCTNPLTPDGSELAVGHTLSGGEMVARWAKDARVVKAFNTTGSGNMTVPAYEKLPLTMFLCGDDPAARATVRKLAAELGFEPCDVGPLQNARLLEPLAMLWIRLAYKEKMGPAIGFALMKR